MRQLRRLLQPHRDNPKDNSSGKTGLWSESTHEEGARICRPCPFSSQEAGTLHIRRLLRFLFGTLHHPVAEMNQPVFMPSRHRVGKFPQFDSEVMYLGTGSSVGHEQFSLVFDLSFTSASAVARKRCSRSC